MWTLTPAKLRWSWRPGSMSWPRLVDTTIWISGMRWIPCTRSTPGSSSSRRSTNSSGAIYSNQEVPGRCIPASWLVRSDQSVVTFLTNQNSIPLSSAGCTFSTVSAAALRTFSRRVPNRWWPLHEICLADPQKTSWPAHRHRRERSALSSAGTHLRDSFQLIGIK